jgi:hypothetical protein
VLIFGEELEVSRDVGESFVRPGHGHESREDAQTRRNAIEFTVEPRLASFVRYPKANIGVQKERVAKHAEEIDDQRSNCQSTVGCAAEFPRGEHDQAKTIPKRAENNHNYTNPINDLSGS